MRNNLDCLRAFGVIYVVGAHLCLAADPKSVDPHGTVRIAITFFFVHTSLVLMQSLERQPKISYFFTKRLFRLAPLNLFVVLAYVAYHFLAFHNMGLRLADVSSNIFFVQNLTDARYVIAPMWTQPSSHRCTSSCP